MLKINLNPAKKEFIQLEEYDANTDAKFIKECLNPYFKDLFKDLSLRCLT
jgi:hypothetical protein